MARQNHVIKTAEEKKEIARRRRIVRDFEKWGGSTTVFKSDFDSRRGMYTYEQVMKIKQEQKAERMMERFFE